MRTTALELSGGKDSVACLYLLRDRLDDITVYWLNTGDNFPETVAVIEECKKIIPHFVEVRSSVRRWIGIHGYPSDVIPMTGEHVFIPLEADEIKCVDSYTCCAMNIMLPLHMRVVYDGIKTVIRGQKACDKHKSPILNGQTVEGITFEFPLEEWTDEDVMVYLAEVDAPVHPIYKTGKHGADCAHCTGWWEHANPEFMARHPNASRFVSVVHETIKDMVTRRMAKLC